MALILTLSAPLLMAVCDPVSRLQTRKAAAAQGVPVAG